MRGEISDGIAGVWAVDLCALNLARYVALAFGLVAPYLALVNGLLHLVGALRERRYNPGLWTGLLLFLPAGGYSARALSRAAHASKGDHARGLGAAILLHAVVMLSLIRGDRD